MSDRDSRAVRLGLMPPLSGVVGIYGTEISRAARIACDEVNEAGGVLGRPLELIVEDDGSLPESAVAAAERLISRHDCSAIIGNLLSNSRIAVAYGVAEPRRVPHLNFSFYEGSILSRYFFHFAAVPNQQIDRMIPHMREMFGPRMFFAGNNYEWPRGSIDAAKRTLTRAGGEIAGEEYHPIGVEAGAIEQLLDRVSASACDVFVPYFAGVDQVNLLTQFTARGLKDRMAVVMGHYDEVMASLLPPDVREGHYSCNTYFMTLASAENRAYLKRLAALADVDGIWPEGNGILTNFGEGAYLCVKAFAQAAEAAGGLDPEELVEALRVVRVSGPQGTVEMDADTHHACVNTYLSRCSRAGTFEIVESFGHLEPVIPERYGHQRVGDRATLESDIRLQARMLEQMSDAVMLVDSRTEIVYASAGAERTFGYPRDELIGLPIASLDVPGVGTLHSSLTIVDEVTRSGAWQGRTRNLRKDGHEISCSVSVTQFTHPMLGEVWLGVYEDVTERERVNTELGRAESLLEHVFDSTSDLQMLVRADDRFTVAAVNRAFRETLAPMWTEDLVGKSIEDCCAALGQTSEQVAVEVHALREAVTERKVSNHLTEFTLGGPTLYLDATVSPVRSPSGACTHALWDARDVTAHRLAARALSESEERLSRVIEATNEGMWDWDILDETFYLSPRYREILGYAKGEASSAAGATESTRGLEPATEWFRSAMHPDDVERTFAAVTRHFEAAEPYDVQFRLRRVDGSYCWVRSCGAAVRDEAGRPVRMVGSVTDITEQREAEDGLRRSEERYALVERAVADGIWDWNLLTKEAYLSPRWKEILGYRDEDLPNLESTFFGLLHPDDAPGVSEGVRRHLEEGDRYDQEIRLRQKDGSYRWVRTRGETVQDDAGHSARMVGSITDIQARREAIEALSESEQRLRHAEALGRIGHYSFDADGGDAFFSDVLKEIWDFPADADLSTNEAFLARIHPEDSERVIADMRRVSGESATLDLSSRILRPDGAVVFTRIIAESSPRSMDGRLRIFGVAVDVTDRMRAETSLRQALEEKEVLLKEIYHRVKNNLQVVASLLVLQGRAVGDARFRALLDESAGRVRSMALVHEQLYRSGDLANIEFREYVERLAEYLSVAHHSMLASPLVSVRMDPIRLGIEAAMPCGLILTELVSNALKHGYGAGASGRVEITATQDSDGLTRLRVQDDGRGLPPGFDPTLGASLGMQLVVTLATQLDAALTWGTEDGAWFEIAFTTDVPGRASAEVASWTS